MTTKNSTKAKAPPLPPLDLLRRYPIPEAARYLSTSHVTVYKLIKGGKIQTIEQGKRRYIPGTEIARLSSAPTAAA